MAPADRARAAGSPASGPLVLEFGPPVCASTVRGAVEDRPERPHEVAMSHVLAGVARDQEQLSAPEVAYLPVAAHEDRRHRLLLPVGRLGLVVTVVGVVGGREQSRMA